MFPVKCILMDVIGWFEATPMGPIEHTGWLSAGSIQFCTLILHYVTISKIWWNQKKCDKEKIKWDKAHRKFWHGVLDACMFVANFMPCF